MTTSKQDLLGELVTVTHATPSQLWMLAAEGILVRIGPKCGYVKFVEEPGTRRVPLEHIVTAREHAIPEIRSEVEYQKRLTFARSAAGLTLRQAEELQRFRRDTDGRSDYTNAKTPPAQGVATTR